MSDVGSGDEPRGEMPTLRLDSAAPLGVIADTHGLLRDEALALLTDCPQLIHLGDVGDPEVLTRLAARGPLHAVRGNIDREGVCAALPTHLQLIVNGQPLQLVHDIADCDERLACAAILHAHSHKPRQTWRDVEGRRQLLFNPGAAGRRRFRLPLTLGKLWVTPEGLRSAIIHLPL
ncbi:metallophosphoesterase family protein [Salinicola sp. RZ23]|uniref:metallophosphoesterase family protein n=1 Tax=Salinicola sp. RZ23 TaxID=1949087 RepID=UPI001E4F2DEA|nr:metallophosphoesterase family protein [Salinicola sp. RZ23]